MIESLNNDRIKLYSKLKNKKYRDEQNLFIVEGKHLVEEAVKSNLVKEIFVLKDYNNNYSNVTYITHDILKKLSSLDNPPKELAICNKLNKNEIKGNIIIIDDIKDPGNLGTIIRSAVSFNYETIIISEKSVDIYNPKVIRATEGMIFNINIIIDSLEDLIPKIKEDYIVYGTDVDNGESPDLIKTKDKHAIIIGSEASGISPNVLALCDNKIYIKISEACESLNASIAASIIMYEFDKE